MSTKLQQFGDFLLDKVDDLAKDLVERQSMPAGYNELPKDEQFQAARQALAMVGQSLRADDTSELLRFAEAQGRARAQANFGINAVLEATQFVRAQTWEALQKHFAGDVEPWSSDDYRLLEDRLHFLNTHLVNGFSASYEQIQHDLASQAEQLEAQRFTIRELGTPILPLYEGIIVLPLVGSVDSYRAAQVMEILLTAITELQSDIVIIDITGVPVVDTGVANYLLQTARAAQLVGARVVLVGIGAEIAQTIVQLGVDMSNIVVYANLQAGIQYALGQLGYKIV